MQVMLAVAHDSVNSTAVQPLEQLQAGRAAAHPPPRPIPHKEAEEHGRFQVHGHARPEAGRPPWH